MTYVIVSKLLDIHALILTLKLSILECCDSSSSALTFSTAKKSDIVVGIVDNTSRSSVYHGYFIDYTPTGQAMIIC
ncbi:MAG TPA: hypothetical protein VE619_07830 [Nitrososphaeraceae archaeon]|nr:hypothetical protein [Nitrososphaeraceae archaeon]